MTISSFVSISCRNLHPKTGVEEHSWHSQPFQRGLKREMIYWSVNKTGSRERGCDRVWHRGTSIKTKSYTFVLCMCCFQVLQNITSVKQTTKKTFCITAVFVSFSLPRVPTLGAPPSHNLCCLLPFTTPFAYNPLPNISVQLSDQWDFSLMRAHRTTKQPTDWRVSAWDIWHQQFDKYNTWAWTLTLSHPHNRWLCLFLIIFSTSVK